MKVLKAGSIRKYILIITLGAVIFSGCSLFKKKSFEDSDTYRELTKPNGEYQRKMDSLNRIMLQKNIDSLNRANDSLAIELDKTMQNIKKSQEQFNKK